MAANSSGAGGLALLAALGLALAVGKGFSPDSARYHTLRFWGVKTRIPRSVVDSEIDRAADRNNIPRNIFRALVHVESGKNPDVVSPKGAIGLGQVMPFNARRCGLSGPKKLFDPIFNLDCGARILREELAARKGPKEALEAYNGGPKCIGKCKESTAYSAKVLSLASKRYS